MSDPSNFERPKITFGGIYRGLIEDNVDPLDAGRLKVRIFGIHDTNNTSIDQLPWAEPALGLQWSGGYNINNEDHPVGLDVPKNKGKRYNPGSSSKVAGTNQSATEITQQNSNKFVEEISDPFGNACGTGGYFVVPKRGNWVFIFFEGGNHMKPIYFAMAPSARDWDTQKIQRYEEISQKINQITDFKGEFSPRPKTKAFDVSNPTNIDTWAPNAEVSVDIGKPDLVVDSLNIGNNNRDITCTTSAQGTTIVIDNRNNNEKIYVIHKNYMEHVDNIGNRKIYVGKGRNKGKKNVNKIPQSKDEDVACNMELGVEGNNEIHVLGKYRLYAKGGVHIQCDDKFQIDTKGDIGIVSRKGDVNVLIKDGNLNADVKGNADLNIGYNANIKVNNNVNLKVGKNVKALIQGSTDVTTVGDIKISTSGNVNLTSLSSLKIAAADIQMTTTSLKVTGPASFTGDVSVGGNLDVVQNTHTGMFSYVGLGINCGGTLVNRGLAELGSPVILHSLSIVPGMAPGTGIMPKIPTIASVPAQSDPLVIREPSNIIKSLI